MATKQTFYQELLTRRERYLKAIEGIDAIIEIERPDEEDDENEVEKSTHLTYGIDSIKDLTSQNLKNAVVPQRVLFALKSIKRGTAQDVALRLEQLIPDYAEGRAFKDARHHLSKYYRAGVVEAEQIGNKNLYKFPGSQDTVEEDEEEEYMKEAKSYGEPQSHSLEDDTLPF